MDSIPFDDEAKAVAAELDGSWQATRTGQRLTLNLSCSQTSGIIRLATAIRRVVGRGRRYDDPNWKWIARRTANALNRSTATLSNFRKS